MGAPEVENANCQEPRNILTILELGAPEIGNAKTPPTRHYHVKTPEMHSIHVGMNMLGGGKCWVLQNAVQWSTAKTPENCRQLSLHSSAVRIERGKNTKQAFLSDRIVFSTHNLRRCKAGDVNQGITSIVVDFWVWGAIQSESNLLWCLLNRACMYKQASWTIQYICALLQWCHSSMAQDGYIGVCHE